MQQLPDRPIRTPATEGRLRGPGKNRQRALTREVVRAACGMSVVRGAVLLLLCMATGCRSDVAGPDAVPEVITAEWYLEHFASCIDYCDDQDKRDRLWRSIRDRPDLVPALIEVAEMFGPNELDHANALYRLGATNQLPAYQYLKSKLAEIPVTGLPELGEGFTLLTALGQGYTTPPEIVYATFGQQIWIAGRALGSGYGLTFVGTERARSMLANYLEVAPSGEWTETIRGYLENWRPLAERE